MRNTAVGNWEAVQSYPPVCSWCGFQRHAYLFQFKSSKKVILYLHQHEEAYSVKITPFSLTCFVSLHVVEPDSQRKHALLHNCGDYPTSC